MCVPLFFVKLCFIFFFFFFFSSRRRHTRSLCDWSSDVCSSDLCFGRKCSTRQPERGCACPPEAWALARLSHDLPWPDPIRPDRCVWTRPGGAHAPRVLFPSLMEEPWRCAGALE